MVHPSPADERTGQGVPASPTGYALPTPLTAFIGRREELARLRELLSRTRALILVGPAGIGKTRLAAELARCTASAFPGGIRMAGTARGSAPALHDLVVEHDETNGPALIVVDGCENRPADTADVIERLLTQVPDLHIIATSRCRLPVPGGVHYAVPPLTTPPAGFDPEDRRGALSYDSIALFADRASAEPAFTLDERNLSEVAALCRSLDGVPLALEQVARWVHVLAPGQILARLGEDDRLLIGSAADGRLQAGLNDMAARCTDDQLTMWARTSVFTGQFQLGDVETICCSSGADRASALETISGLIDRSVLHCEQHDDGNTYRLLAPLRMFGRAQLRRTGEQDALLMRLRDRLLDIAESVEPFWMGNRAVRQSDELVARLDDVEAALQFSLDHDEPSEALRLATLLRLQWMVADRMREGATWIAKAMNRCTPHDELRTRALFVLSYLTGLSGDYSRHQAAVEAGRGSSPTGSSAEFDFAEGLSAWTAGDYTTAVDHLRTALSSFVDSGAEAQVREAVFVLGLIMTRTGPNEESLKAIETNLAKMAAENTWWGTSWAAMSRGFAAIEAGDAAAAIPLLRGCLRQMSDRHDRVIVWWCLELLAKVAADTGEHRKAMLLLGAAKTHGLRRLPRELDDRRRLIVEPARQALGPHSVNRLFRKGQALPLAQAIDLAMGGSPEDPDPPEERLSARELEVARFVAEGKTNRDIATALVVSVRTAEGHVQRILTKRGFHSRAQIAAWVTQNDNEK